MHRVCRCSPSSSKSISLGPWIDKEWPFDHLSFFFQPKYFLAGCFLFVGVAFATHGEQKVYQYEGHVVLPWETAASVG